MCQVFFRQASGMISTLVLLSHLSFLHSLWSYLLYRRYAKGWLYSLWYGF
jgi:hypothetical protein